MNVKYMKTIFASVVCAGLLAQPSYSKPHVASHALDAAFTFGAAMLGGTTGLKWYSTYHNTFESEVANVRREKATIEENFLGDPQDEQKIERLEQQEKDIIARKDQNDATYKAKTSLYVGCLAAGMACMVSRLKGVTSEPLSSDCFVSSKQLLLSNLCSAGSFGVAAAGGAYTSTHLLFNDFAEGRILTGFAKLCGIAAASIGLKVVAHKYQKAGVKENISSIVKNWETIARKHSLHDQTLAELSKKQDLNDNDYALAEEKLTALGFNKAMNGLVK